MGSLLKSVSKLIARQPSSSAVKQSTVTSLTDGDNTLHRHEPSSSGTGHVTPSQQRQLDPDVNSSSKRRSSAPEVEPVKRSSSMSSSDSGVEQDRSMSRDDITTENPKSSRPRGTHHLTVSAGGGSARQVGFQDDVIVHSSCVVDVDGSQKEISERRMLRMSSFQRERKLERSAAIRSSSFNETNVITKPEPPTCWTTPVDCMKEPEVRLAIVREPRTGARHVRLIISLGPSFAGGVPVMVKTNSSGTKVHLLAHRLHNNQPPLPPPGTSSSRHKSKSDGAVYRDSFPLPVVVDPERVTATVDTDGRVTVEALIVAPSDPLLEKWDRHQSSSAASHNRLSRDRRR